MMMLVPIYFQVSAHASLTSAGMHLTPSVIGNAIGGLVTGYIIKRFSTFLFLSSFLRPINYTTELENTNLYLSSAPYPPQLAMPSFC